MNRTEMLLVLVGAMVAVGLVVTLRANQPRIVTFYRDEPACARPREVILTTPGFLRMSEPYPLWVCE